MVSEFRKRVRSFKVAFLGLKEVFVSQINFRIHLIITVFVVVAGVIIELNFTEWAIILLLTGAVLAFETLNTALEFLADLVSPEIHPSVKRVKDISAAAVLIMAATGVAIGLIVFLPKIL